jgi:hypothetical protein
MTEITDTIILIIIMIPFVLWGILDQEREERRAEQRKRR